MKGCVKGRKHLWEFKIEEERSEQPTEKYPTVSVSKFHGWKDGLESSKCTFILK